MPDAYNPWGAPVFPTAADNAMQPETFVPQGVQDWTRQAAPKDYNILSQIAGSLGKALMYPGQVAQSQTPISTEDMVGPAFNLAGMLTLGAGAAPQEANALNMGIKAYHGSPHDFDKFDLSKIGTGEGAQAYGHGLYFAESPGVAQSYRDALAPMRVTDAQGRPPMNDIWGEMTSAARQAAPDAHYSTANQVAEDIHSRMRNGDDLAAFRQEMEQSQKSPQEKAMYRAALDQGQKYNVEKTGKMYEVNINADPSHFLDWDKPLSQQHPVVQEALNQFGIPQQVTADDLFTQLKARGWDDKMARDYAEQQAYQNKGAHAYRELETRARSGEPSDYMKSGDQGRISATDQLREAGIPGIKYLDQGSRVAPPDGAAASISMFESALRKHPNDEMLQQQLANAKAQMAEWEKSQSRNYVVFNHDLIDIMRKYAVPGMLGAPILANALSEQKT